MNNNIYIPLKSSMLRMEDSYSDVRDEIDGIYLAMSEKSNLSEAAQVIHAVLDSSHHGADDYSVIVPAELLAQQKRTEQMFNTVMVAIASISLLVGGIGIMNIMLASILERTREIGLRRAVGARQSDIVRQFVVEAMMISFAGGTIGVVFGFFISRVIAWLAGWSTIVTFSSIALAFLVSISVGLVFGIYPATKAARLDPWRQFAMSRQPGSGFYPARVLHSFQFSPSVTANFRSPVMKLAYVHFFFFCCPSHRPRLSLQRVIRSRELSRPADRARPF